MQTYVERFIAEKTASVAAGDLSAGRNYSLRLHVTHFRDWIGSGTHVVDINGTHLSEYRRALLENVKAKKWSRTTASDRLKFVRSFIQWLWLLEAIPTLPRIMADESNPLKIRKNSPTVVVYTKQEIATLLRRASDRTKLYILLMLNCGMTQKYASLEDLFLGHAPRRMSDKHYTVAPQTLFEEAIVWLGTEFEISATPDVSVQS